MRALPPPALRTDVFEEFGDQGADTLDRYFAQLEYTASWCIRMLDPVWKIRVVIPEGVEDLVVVRAGCFELRQIKTRDESVGAWRITELLPVLSAQYSRSYAFGERRFTFHFVSDARADVRRPRGEPASLERLKEVLSLHRRGVQLRPQERSQLTWFLNRLPGQLLDAMLLPEGNTCNIEQTKNFLLNTFIETNEATLRQPQNIDAMHECLTKSGADRSVRTVPQLRAMYERLLLLIIRRIRQGTDLQTRAIRRADVLACRDTRPDELSDLDLERLPGRSVLEKKTRFAGFDAVEAKQFRRQSAYAKVQKREITAMNLGAQIEYLDLALADLLRRERRILSAQTVLPSPFGPELLERVRPNLASIASAVLPPEARPNEMLCQGLLWESTQRCESAWHPFRTAAP